MGIISAKNLLPHVERRMKFVRFVSRWVQLYCFSPHQNRYSIIRQRSPARASKLLIRFRYWSRAISFSFQTNCLIATTTTTIFPPAINWAFFRLIKNHEMKPGNELLTMLDDELAGSEFLQFRTRKNLLCQKHSIWWLRSNHFAVNGSCWEYPFFNLWHGVLATVTHVLHLTIKNDLPKAKNVRNSEKSCGFWRRSFEEFVLLSCGWMYWQISSLAWWTN